MAPVRIVPALNVAEAGHARLGLALEAVPRQQLRLQGREEALAHRVVVSIPDRAHGRPHACLPATAAEGQRSILAALDALLFVKQRCASRSLALWGRAFVLFVGAAATVRAGSPIMRRTQP